MVLCFDNYFLFKSVWAPRVMLPCLYFSGSKEPHIRAFKWDNVWIWISSGSREPEKFDKNRQKDLKNSKGPRMIFSNCISTKMDISVIQPKKFQGSHPKLGCPLSTRSWKLSNFFQFCKTIEWEASEGVKSKCRQFHLQSYNPNLKIDMILGNSAKNIFKLVTQNKVVLWVLGSWVISSNFAKP